MCWLGVCICTFFERNGGAGALQSFIKKKDKESLKKVTSSYASVLFPRGFLLCHTRSRGVHRRRRRPIHRDRFWKGSVEDVVVRLVSIMDVAFLRALVMDGGGVRSLKVEGEFLCAGTS